MAPEPTKASKRRSNRREVEEFKFDGGHAREIESKRNRGEISCAECRRLKIKCDREIPCGSCLRRGCGSLCPNGSLATGQGTRFVLAATEHLHKRIAKISDRVRQLEDALASLQAKHYNEPHPLLRDDLLAVNNVQDDDAAEIADDSSGPSSPAEVMDSFGTLSISDHGISRYFGLTGGPESLLRAAGQSSSQASRGCSQSPDSLRSSKSMCSLSSDLTMLPQSFPFAPMGPVIAVPEIIESHLPSWERALYLAETYLDHTVWLFRGIDRPQLIEELLPVFYKKQVPCSADLEGYSGPHDLALLFTVFAIGAFLDPEQDRTNSESEHYHQIAWVAISLQPVLEKPSLVTIQTLHLLGIYNTMKCNEVGIHGGNMETTWSLITLAIHLAQSIGLHRDSARWGLPPKMVERRRVLFWDLFVADSWQSLNTGRPPSLSLTFIDCRLPHDEEQKRNAKGETEPGYKSWGSRFAMECVADVAARILSAEGPTYATIMDLDRKVREFPIPEDASAMAASAGPMSDEQSTPAAAIMRCLLSHAREVILLYIHRGFFAQAITEHPLNPLRSQYAPSFLAAYRASSTILRTIRDQFAVHPKLCSRLWSMWTFAFTASMVFGTIVTRGPCSPLASNAISELDQACLLFSKAAVHSRRAARALSILTKLSEKAHIALASAQNDPSSVPRHRGSFWNLDQEDDEDELAILAGRTRLVSRRGCPTPVSFSPHRQESNTPPYSAPHLEATPMHVSSSYYSDTSISNESPMSHWGSEPRRDDYVEPRRAEYMPVHDRQISQHYQTAPHFPTQNQAPVSASYQWQQGPAVPSHFYDGQQYHPPTNYQQQPQLFIPNFQTNQSLSPPNAVVRLTAAGSRMDDRWTPFMPDSGLVDEINFNPTRVR